MRLFCVCVFLCLGSSLATGWSLVQGVLPSVKNNYRAEEEACALNGLKEPLKKILIEWFPFWNLGVIQSSLVNYCWPSPAQSFLVFSPIWTHDLIYIRSKTVYVFGNGVSSSTRGGVCLSNSVPYLLHYNFAQVYPHSRSVRIRAFVFHAEAVVSQLNGCKPDHLQV
jgi:hypothetical protein